MRPALTPDPAESAADTLPAETRLQMAARILAQGALRARHIEGEKFQPARCCPRQRFLLPLGRPRGFCGAVVLVRSMR